MLKYLNHQGNRLSLRVTWWPLWISQSLCARFDEDESVTGASLGEGEKKRRRGRERGRAISQRTYIPSYKATANAFSRLLRRNPPVPINGKGSSGSVWCDPSLTYLALAGMLPWYRQTKPKWEWIPCTKFSAKSRPQALHLRPRPGSVLAPNPV